MTDDRCQIDRQIDLRFHAELPILLRQAKDKRKEGVCVCAYSFLFLVKLQGLLIRTQNCSSSVGGECTKCNFGPCQDLSKPGPVGPGAWVKHQCQDVITFVELLNNDNQVSTLGRPHNPAI